MPRPRPDQTRPDCIGKERGEEQIPGPGPGKDCQRSGYQDDDRDDREDDLEGDGEKSMARQET